MTFGALIETLLVEPSLTKVDLRLVSWSSMNWPLMSNSWEVGRVAGPILGISFLLIY